MSSWKYLCFQEYINHRSDGKQAYFLKNNVRKKKMSEKKEWKKRAAHIFALLKKNECHSHFAPFDKKEWHSSFAPYFGSGAQEWRSKECRSLTHWFLSILGSPWGYPRGNSSISTNIMHQPQKYTDLALWRVINFCKESLSVISLWPQCWPLWCTCIVHYFHNLIKVPTKCVSLVFSIALWLPSAGILIFIYIGIRSFK